MIDTGRRFPSEKKIMIMEYSIDAEKLLSELTVAEFGRMLDERINAAAGCNGGCREEDRETGESMPSDGYAYGLDGIMELFGVCKATAQRYKNGFLQPAIIQRGRKILIDKAKALELFRAERRAS